MFMKTMLFLKKKMKGPEPQPLKCDFCHIHQPFRRFPGHRVPKSCRDHLSRFSSESKQNMCKECLAKGLEAQFTTRRPSCARCPICNTRWDMISILWSLGTDAEGKRRLKRWRQEEKDYKTRKRLEGKNKVIKKEIEQNPFSDNNVPAGCGLVA